jgi:hypothetical protein
MNTAYCEEDTLSYLIIPSGDILSIEISDSYQPHTCFQKTSFLKTRILLPQFNDSLPLKLNLGSASIIQFTVFKNSSDYNIEINNGIGLINKFEKTERIPDNLIWGYAYPKILGAEGTLRMNDFIREVQGYCYTARLSPGFYSYFTLSDKNELILNENPGITGNFSNFFYLNFEPKESLQQYFDNLASKYYNLVGYKITTGTGKEFKSN